MGEGKDQRTQSPSLPPHQDRHAKDEDNWLIMRGGDDGTYNTSSLDNSSTNTNGSTSSSSDMVDDASSSPLNPSGPLFELSELIANLPIKRGLSKYYEGKSQSFTSLFSVSCTEDLAKKGVPHRRKSKACKSYGNGLDGHKPYPLPKAVISKKAMHSLYLRPLSPAPIHKKF